MHTKINACPEHWDRRGLPSWTYRSQGLFNIELEKIFRTHWQLVCHQSDISDAGSYTTFDVGNDRALIIRGHDDEIRAFHNLCRHLLDQTRKKIFLNISYLFGNVKRNYLKFY